MNWQNCYVIFCLHIIFLIGKVKYQASLRRVCYYTNWAQYRNGPGKFYPENVDPSLCTHIIYAFAKMVGNHLAAFEWNDESTPWMKGMYARFHAIKQQNPSVQLLLAVGGWNMGSAPFTHMVASDANRRDFAKTSAAFLRKHNFDGIDIDWEYPANRGSPPGDKHKFTQLLQTLHDEFQRESMQTGRPRLLLTSAVSAGKDKIDTAYEIPEISRYLDFINLMTYDLHGSWEDHTGHNSPLYSRTGETGNETFLNLNWAAQYWASKGAPKNKINVGLALYGRTFKLPYSHTDDKIGCPAAGAGQAGQYTREAGFMAYYEICQKLYSGASKRYEPEQKVPYMVQNELWVGYDDPDSLKIKVDYIKQNNFGGIMVWALDLDDFSGMCGQGKFPLMKAIINAINSIGGGSTGGGSSGGGSTITGPIGPIGPINFIPTLAPTTKTTEKPTTHGNIFPVFTFPHFTFPPAPTTPPTTTTTTTTSQAPTTTAAPTTATSTTAKPTTAKPTTDTTTAGTITSIPTTQPAPGTTKDQGLNGIFHQLTPVSRLEFDCAIRNDGYYPSPSSCSQYYVCAAGITFRTDCHPGLLFNSISLYCDFADHVTCKAGHSPQHNMATKSAPVVTAAPIVTQTPTTRTQAPTTTPTTTSSPTKAQFNGNPADFCKGKADGFYRDPTSCTHFYSCSFEVSYHEPCPANTYFSEVLQGCDWKSNVPNCP